MRLLDGGRGVHGRDRRLRRAALARWCSLAVPAAVLTGLAFSAPLMAYAATLKGNDNFNVVFRFVITPLFLFSGVFFPLTRLPEGAPGGRPGSRRCSTASS